LSPDLIELLAEEVRLAELDLLSPHIRAWSDAGPDRRARIAHQMEARLRLAIARERLRSATSLDQHPDPPTPPHSSSEHFRSSGDHAIPSPPSLAEVAKRLRRFAKDRTIANAEDPVELLYSRILEIPLSPWMQELVDRLATQLGRSSERRQGPTVILGEPHEQPIVRGKLKDRLTIAQYDVVNTVLDAGERGLSKDELVQKSRHEDALGVLRRLRRNDPDWASVIQMAGKPGGRYRIIP
jgi:hypothetical protein